HRYHLCIRARSGRLAAQLVSRFDREDFLCERTCRPRQERYTLPWGGDRTHVREVYREIAVALDTIGTAGVTITTRVQGLQPSVQLHLLGGKACKNSQLSR